MQKMGQFGAVRGHSRSWAMSPFDRAHTTSYLTLIENRNHASVLYRFRDIAGYLWKVADFDPPHLHLVPPQGVTPVEFCEDLQHQKTRLPGAVCVILLLAVLVELRLVADRRTERRTQAHGQYRGCIASRGKNKMKNCNKALQLNRDTKQKKEITKKCRLETGERSKFDF